MLTPSIGFCAMPSTIIRCLDAGGFENRRHDVDDVVELRANAARILDVAGPGDDHTLPGAAEEGGHLLGPLERCVEGPGPRHRHVRGGHVGAQDVVELQLSFDRHVDALNRGEVERRADRGAFGAGAVVAADVDDQRVIELAQVFHGLDHPADFVVGIGDVGGEDFRLVGEHLLLIGLERIPFRQAVRPGSELGVRGDHAELLLVGENLLAQLVPAHVELALHLCNPLRRRMMRRMRAARDVIEEERLLWRGGIQPFM